MSTATISPDGTLLTAGVSVTGAASVYAALSDNDSNSYITLSTEKPVVSMGTFALGSARMKSYTPKIRMRANSTAVDLVFGVIIQDVVGNAFPSSGRLTYGPDGGSFYSDVAFPTVAASFTQAQIDAMAWVFDGVSGSEAGRIAKAWIDITYVTKPSTALTAVSPDPYTASNLVPLSWVNTLDADGGGQTHYQIKAFDQTTYPTLSSVDPDTDTPFWESGVTASGLTSAATGALIDGDTYRIAVRVAQTVNGSRFWSDWSTDDVTINVATSDVAAVSAVATDADGKLTVTVTRAGGSEAWSKVSVERSIDAGVTWAPVRFATFADATGNANTFTVDDYEVPNGTAALYRALASRTLNDQPIVGDWTQAGAAVSWSSNDCWLKDPNVPANSTTFRLGGRRERRRTRRVGVFPVVGLSAPITVSDVRSTNTGVLPIVTDTIAEYDAIDDLLAAAPTILVQFPPSTGYADMYATVTSDVDNYLSPVAEAVVRVWEVEYVETSAPADSTAGVA